MSDALEQASLIMVPSGYEDGTLGSLKPLDGSGDFTFSRGSDISATRVNADGYIEKGYENLLLQSNQFDTTWSSNPVLTPNQLGYDGSNDAWLVEKSAAFNNVGQSISLSGVQTFSVYAKAGTQEWIRLRMSGSQTCYYHLFEDGYIGVNSGTISQVIESIGNGWYRCSMTISATASSVNIYSAEDDNVMGTSGSIYIQDAMLNQGMVSYPYVETTTAPVAGGILEDMPRLDGSCPALLLEPQRTNILPYSEYFDGFTYNTEDTTLVANSEISPEGLQNAYKITADAVFNYHRIRQTNISTSIGNSYTISIFAKSNGHDFILFRVSQIAASNRNVSFNISTGAVDFKSSVFDNASVEDYGNGWYRCWATFTSDDPTIEWYLRSQPTTQIGTDDGIDRYTGDGVNGAYIYGAQVEEGSYPTSYIPTYGTSQTRLKDICEALDVVSLIGQTEGTLFIDYVHKLVDGTYNVFGIDSGNNTSRIWLLNSTSPAIRYSVDGVSLSSAASGFQYIEGQQYKVAMIYNTTYIKVYINGSLIIDDSGFTAPTIQTNFKDVSFAGTNNSFTFDNPVNQALVFPTALSDDECIALTTIS